MTLILSVWDIGGQSLNSKNLGNYLEGSKVVFLCYDVTDPQSFEDLGDWLGVVRKAINRNNDQPKLNIKEDADGKKKKKKKPPPPPKIYIVGNKIDLIQYRRITEAAHDTFVSSENLDGGFFMSAGNGENVLTAFYKVAGQSAGLELSAYELGFTDKVLAGTLSEENEKNRGKTEGSEKLEQEDQKAHEDLMKALGSGKGLEAGEGGCHCAIS